jgi:ABC-type dipeptide/oligopeptide/nickel transport system permease subunit
LYDPVAVWVPVVGRSTRTLEVPREPGDVVTVSNKYLRWAVAGLASSAIALVGATALGVVIFFGVLQCSDSSLGLGAFAVFAAVVPSVVLGFTASCWLAVLISDKLAPSSTL